MPDRRRHRGLGPKDGELFAEDRLATLQVAVSDLSWLLSRGYTERSALKLVGDRYELVARQRSAIARCACSEQSLERRAAKEISADALGGQQLAIDGFNLLTTLEVALSGGVLLVARDRCIRDIASIHGNYRLIDETRPSIRLLLDTLEHVGAEEATVYLDQPVSNSGRLAKAMRAGAQTSGIKLRFEVETVTGVDELLKASEAIVASADSAILDRCQRWTNLTRIALERAGVELSPFFLDLQMDSDPTSGTKAGTARSYTVH